MDDRFGKYTERAKKVMALAKEEARSFNHNYLDTEHLLVGLAGEGQGVAGRVLANLGVDLPRVREAMMFMIGRGEGPTSDDPPLTSRAERALQLATEEARTLGHQFIGTEHLLLALTRTDDPEVAQSVAPGLLQGLGVLEHVRPAVMAVLTNVSGMARTRDNVVTCRIDDRVLGALDALVEAGVYTTRSQAAARLILAGIEANRPLLEKVYAAATQIRRVREDTQALTKQWAAAEMGT